MEINQPKIIVVSAPSGTGKTTLIKLAKEKIPDLQLSVSHTTRSPRSGEQHGVDYYFISEDQFKEMITEDDFLEWAEVHGNYYGTSTSQIKKFVAEGKIVVLDIDVQGAMEIKLKSDLEATYFFIEPPSLHELKSRLENRQTETTQSLAKRIQNAETELTFKNRYDYVIMNDKLDNAVEEFIHIISKVSYD